MRILDHNSFLNFSLDLAAKAGNIVRKNFGLGMEKTWKKDNSPLTVTDTTINSFILQEIKKEFPNHSIHAEEGSLGTDSDYVWVCDPVDGTVAFSHGIPTSTFSLALVHKGECIIGVIFDPFLNRMFYAQQGKGAFLNKDRIYVSKNQTLHNTVIGMAWSKESPHDLLALYGVLKERNVRILNVGSILYMGALVACGEFAATIYPNKKLEDSAVLKIIVEEAGGKVTGLFGEDQRYDQEVDGHLASNNYLYQELVELIKAHVE